MLKKYVPLILAVVSGGLLVFAYVLKKQNEADTKATTIAKAAMADQLDIYEDDHFENTKMMSEGSHYGIDYYDDLRRKLKK